MGLFDTLMKVIATFSSSKVEPQKTVVPTIKPFIPPDLLPPMKPPVEDFTQAKTVDLVHPETISTVNKKNDSNERFGELFDRCFIHAMNWEAYGGSPLFDVKDPVVIAGDVSTKENKRKCGYTSAADQPDDHGGETKFGVAQKAHPELNIFTLTLAQAEKVYYNGYFLAVKADQLKGLVGAEMFDIACGSGPYRAIKLLQQTIGVVADGVIGPITIAAANALDPDVLLKNLVQTRCNYYRSIVANDASQAKFLNGWLRRANDLSWPAIK